MKNEKYNKLEIVRIKHGFSHQQMADKLNICKAYYWQIENKQKRLGYDLAIKIANIFNLRPDDIFYEE